EPTRLSRRRDWFRGVKRVAVGWLRVRCPVTLCWSEGCSTRSGAGCAEDGAGRCSARSADGSSPRTSRWFRREGGRKKEGRGPRGEPQGSKPFTSEEERG